MGKFKTLLFALLLSVGCLIGCGNNSGDSSGDGDGEEGGGQWIQLTEVDENGTFSLKNIDDDALGMIICRLSDDPINEYVWNEQTDTIIWNKTEEILLI